MEFLLFTKKCDDSLDSVFDSSRNISDYIDSHYNDRYNPDRHKNICEFISSQQNVLDEVEGIFIYDMNGNVYTKDGLFDMESVYYAYYNLPNNEYQKWHDKINSFNDNPVGEIGISTVLNMDHNQTRVVEYWKYYKIGKNPFLIVYDIDIGKFFGDKYRSGNYGVMLNDDTLYPEDDLMITAKEMLSLNKDGRGLFDFGNTEYVTLFSSSNKTS